MVVKLQKVIFMLTIVIVFTSGLWAQENDHVYVVTAVAWSPDGETLAVTGRTSEQGMVWLYDALGNSIGTIDFSGTALGVSWSLDGTRLAVRYDTERGTRLSIWDWESFNPVTPLITTEELIGTSARYPIAWSPTGRYIAVNSSVWVYIIDTTTGNQVTQLYDRERTGTAGVLDVAWSVDEQSVYVLYEARDANQLLQWDIHTSQVTQTVLSRVDFFPIGMGQSPDGNQFAVSEGHGSVVILRVPDFNIKQELFVSQGESNIPYVSHLIWSKDNRELYGLADDGTLYLWDVMSGELKAVDALIPDSASFLRDSAISPYGGRLAISVRWHPGVSSLPETFETNTSYQFLLDGTVQIVVPFPSLERLQAIAELCVQDSASAELAAPLTRQAVTESTLPEFVAQVEALPENTIPPACAADLIAVAEAIQGR